MKIIKLKLKDLKPAEYNPRQSSKEQEKHLQESLKKFGIVEPVVVNQHKDRFNIIVGGHFRVRELKKLKYEEADCVIVDLPLKEEKELNVRLNKNTGEFDFDILANEFELDELIDWGFEDMDFGMGDEEENEVEEDEVPEVKKESIVKKGDVWLLGEHRLCCGDSTILTDVEKITEGEKADLLFTDPPYGMKKEKDGVLNDNLNYDDLLEFNKEWITNSFLQLKDNGSWYCWGIDEPLMDIYSHIIKPMISEQKATFRNLITWDKGNGQGQNSENTRSYAIADEKCLFVMCGVQGFNNNADNYFEGWDSVVNYLDSEKTKAKLTIKDCKRLAGHSENSGCHWFDKSQWYFPTKENYDSWRNHCQQNNIEAFKKEYEELKKEYEELKKEYEELKKEYYSTRAYFDNVHDNFNNVWHFDRTRNEEREGTGGHATPKPLALCSRAIKSSCPKDGLVIDLFLGSGSTLIAAEQTGRRCVGLELCPNFFQVIIDRYINLKKNNGDDVYLLKDGDKIPYKEVVDGKA